MEAKITTPNCLITKPEQSIDRADKRDCACNLSISHIAWLQRNPLLEAKIVALLPTTHELSIHFGRQVRSRM